MNTLGRTVPPWVGKSPDAAIPARVKARIWFRCNGRCAITGRKLSATDPHDYDHIKPLWAGGVHGEENLQLVSRDKHREKTAAEAPMRAKADRMGAKFRGEWPKSKRPLRSRSFPKSRPQQEGERG